LEDGAAQAEVHLRATARLGEQAFLGALEGEALVVEQRLDPQHQLQVAAPVQALARGVLLRAQQLELRLPVAQDVGGHFRDRLDLAAPGVELLGNRRRGVHGWFSRSFSPLLGLNVSTLRAVISMLPPVCGLRPRREAFWRMRKCPKPTIFTSSLLSKKLKMMSNSD